MELLTNKAVHLFDTHFRAVVPFAAIAVFLAAVFLPFTGWAVEKYVVFTEEQIACGDCDRYRQWLLFWSDSLSGRVCCHKHDSQQANDGREAK